MARKRKPQEIDERRATQLVEKLMGIPGQSGQEGDVVRYIRQQLRRAGLDDSAVEHDAVPRRSPIGGEIGNLIIKLPGTQRAPRRLLMAHLDTVPLCVGAVPIRRGDYYFSQNNETALGADNRSGTAVVLTALLEILRRRPQHPPLTFLLTVQEEIGLVGARYVSRSKLGRPQLCFNWDGREPEAVIIGATGTVHIQIVIDGIASHAGAHPEEGVNSLAVASLAIEQLVRDGWHGQISRGGQRGTSNIGIVRGGTATNVVLPRVELEAEVRSHDSQFRERIVRAFREAFDGAAQELPNQAGRTATIRFTPTLKYESFLLAQDSPAVQTAAAAIRRVDREPMIRACNGGLDANWLTQHGFPTVTLGAGQAEIHTVNENLHLPSFLDACRIAWLLATGQEADSLEKAKSD